MKNVLKVFLCLTLFSVVILSTVFAASIKKQPEFVLEKFQMKLGDTQAISGIINGEVTLDGFESSNEDAVKILSTGSLKAVATGLSTITYTYKDSNDKTVVLKCYVEVTRYNSTFDTVGGGISKETIFLTLHLDNYDVKVESSSGAIPKFPEVTKEGYIFQGWYLDETLETKVTEKQRFSKDTTFYAKWATEAEVKEKSIASSEFYDDVAGHWAKTAIDSVTYAGLFKGTEDRMFGPELTMSRAMAVTVLGRLEGLTEKDIEGKKSGLSDTNERGYYDGYLAWAIENKVVTDIADNKFRPNDDITREEMANYIANYMKLKNYKVEKILDISYNDVNDLSSSSKEALTTLYNAGIMQGVSSNSFAPKASTTRAQIAQIFYNYNNFVKKYN